MSLLKIYMEAIEKDAKLISVPGFEYVGMGGGFWALVKTLPNKKVVVLSPPDVANDEKGKLYELSKEHQLNPDRDRRDEDKHAAFLYNSEEDYDNANENLKQKEPTKIDYFVNQEQLDKILNKWSK